MAGAGAAGGGGCGWPLSLVCGLGGGGMKGATLAAAASGRALERERARLRWCQDDVMARVTSSHDAQSKTTSGLYARCSPVAGRSCMHRRSAAAPHPAAWLACVRYRAALAVAGLARGACWAGLLLSLRGRGRGGPRVTFASSPPGDGSSTDRQRTSSMDGPIS